ncbi:MAG: hypothetical protein ABJQ29_01960 [Luteolibacter sp.]
MKNLPYLILPVCHILLVSCDDKKEQAEETKPVVTEATRDLMAVDIPMLPLKKGDFWKYKVSIEIPAGITSEGASAVEIDQEKTRTYLGKVKVAKDYPEVDAFDVTMRGEATERELVEIHEDRILMRGSTRPDQLDAKPLWMDPPIPFVVAGIRAGQEMASLGLKDGSRSRGIKVVAREKLTTAIGEFPAIRLLMTGNDGKFELRKTIWFVPGLGIAKEEKTRYAEGKLIFRETTLLEETSVIPRQ